MTNSSYWQRLALTAIDVGRQTHIAKFLPELATSQWLPTKTLAEMQLARLQQMLTFASQHVPFYIRLFAENRWHPGDFCSLYDLESLPIITKDTLRRAPLDFMPRQPDSHFGYKSRHTGGSTGEPLAYRVANDAFGMWWAATLRVWQATGYVFGERMLTLTGASVNHRPASGIAERVYDLLRNNHTIPVGELDVADLNRIVTQLTAIGPSLLYGYPSILYLLAHHIVRQAVVIPSIRRVVTTSEMLFPGQRRLIEQAFHAPVYDDYGCPEVGLIAGECRYRQGLHYAMESCLVEVLDNANARVPMGHTGRLVATNLLNRAMCLIRYDTGDVGAVSDEACECGRGLLQIRNLEGRSRDLIYAPGKKFIHGVAINHMISSYPWIDRYQIIQETPRDLTVNLGVSRAIAPYYIEQLRSQLAEYTDMNVAALVNEPFIETNCKKHRLIISKIRIPDETE